MTERATAERPSGREAAPLAEVAAVFLRLGATAFGGPAAHIALMREELVRRRRWLDDARFLDLVGAANLVPGPTSTELAIHLGYARAGWAGLAVAGACFILPAMTIVLALAWAYVTYGSLPAVGWLLYGVKPVIVAVVGHALWGLLRTAITGPATAAIALGAFSLTLLGLDEIAVLVAGAAAGVIARRPWAERPVSLALLWPAGGLPLLGASAAEPVGLGMLLLTFLKIGSVLYGSGYVLLAFLRADFVERLGWLSEPQLLDAVAVGQFTPGPVFTTATFIGYLVAGVPGALLATLGVFLPAFIFVAAIGPFVERLRRSPWTGALLDGVNAASLALMAAVTLTLARAAVVDLVTIALALISLALLLRTRLNSAWLVLGGGLAGLAARLLQG